MIRNNPFDGVIQTDTELFPHEASFVREGCTHVAAMRSWRIIYNSLLVCRTAGTWGNRDLVWAAARTFALAGLSDKGQEDLDSINSFLDKIEGGTFPGCESVYEVIRDDERLQVLKVVMVVLGGGEVGENTDHPFLDEAHEKAVVETYACVHDGIQLDELCLHPTNQPQMMVQSTQQVADFAMEIFRATRPMPKSTTGSQFLETASNVIFQHWGAEAETPSAMAGTGGGCEGLDGEALRDARIAKRDEFWQADNPDAILRPHEVDAVLGREGPVLIDEELFGPPEGRDKLFGRAMNVAGYTVNSGTLIQKFSDIGIVCCMSRGRFTDFMETGNLKGWWDTPEVERDTSLHDAPGDVKARNDAMAFGGKADLVTHAIVTTRFDNPQLVNHNFTRLISAFGGDSPVLVQLDPDLIWQSTFTAGDYNQAPTVFKASPNALARAAELRFMLLSMIASKPLGQAMFDKLAKLNGVWQSLMIGIGGMNRSSYFELQIHGELCPNDVKSAELMSTGKPISLKEVIGEAVTKHRAISRTYEARPKSSAIASGVELKPGERLSEGGIIISG